MIRTYRNTVMLLICMLLLLASCNSRSDEESRQNEFSQSFVPLRVDTVDRLEEIDAWGIMERGGAVSLIRHNLALNRLTVISEKNQKVELFSVERGESITQQIVDIPNLRVLGIDEKGEKLLVGMSDQTLNEQGEPREYFHWFAIWNVTSGSLDRCISGSCIGELTDPDKIAYADIGAVMDAETVVAYDEDSFVVTILSPEGGGDISLVNSPDADYWWHIGRVAVNSDQNRLAIVFQEGGITLRKVNETGNWPLAWIDVLEQGEKNQLQPIQDATLDPRGRWLAIVRGQDLVIWQVSGWKREVFREQIGNVHGMRFNPSGQLLLVRRDDAISVIGLEERKAVFEMPTPGITSLDISDNNRLLFWGDENGTVHFWGIR
jgi:hypothetical protein